MSKILVTGGAGMIGSNLVKKLVCRGDEVLVVDNLWRGKLAYLNENGTPVIDLRRKFFNRDLSVAGSIDSLLKDVDYLIHLADVVAGIDYVFNNQSFIFRQNLLINSNVFSSVRKNVSTIKGVIYVGTACSFPYTLQNSFEPTLLKEEQLFPAYPESAYGWSKLMGQYELDILGREVGIPVISLILHNVYGAPADFGERSQVIPSLINKVIQFPKEEFIVWGTGKQGRAFIHVDDVVNGIILSLVHGWGHSPIQLGPSVCTSIKEISELIVKISGKEIPIKFDTSRPDGDLARAANYSKAKKILGWEPKVELEEGILKLYKWIESHYLEKRV